jgi:hypothetical protein
MHAVFKYSLLLRTLLTPLLFLTRTNVLYSVILLTLLDIIDCNPIVMKLLPEEARKKGCSYDKTYQLADKTIDLIQYIVAVFLLRPVLPSNIFSTILFLIIYRIAGLALYLQNNNPKTFIIFFDFIKELLVLSYKFNGAIPNIILIPAMLLKMIYEHFMHDKHIFLDMYNIIFE